MTDSATGSFSFEFFPPKTDKGIDNLTRARGELARLGPEFFSVTFGAGGTTRSGTLETVLATTRQTGIEAAPHLSCVEGTCASIGQLLQSYKDNGVKRIVALRGDLPDGMTSPGEFAYASELVAFIREQFGDTFHLEVGAYPEGHPETAHPVTDTDNFVRKVEAGANSAITQYFFNADAYFDFVERVQARGVDIPIVPGIMPIPNWGQIARFSAMCGADVPRWIARRMDAYHDADDQASVRAFGIEVVTTMCQRLLDAGIPGLHFYALNRAEPTASIWKNLGLPPAHG